MWEDREELAAFVLEHSERVRAIARRKLRPSTRGAFGSDDVLSTVLRRLDALAAGGLVRAESEAQLWALVRSIAENVSLQRERLLESTLNRSGEDAVFWSQVHKDFRRNSTDDEGAFVRLYELLMTLHDPDQRQLFMFRLRGVSHKVIAQYLDTTPDAIRQRWHSVAKQLRSHLASEGSDGPAK